MGNSNIWWNKYDYSSSIKVGTIDITGVVYAVSICKKGEIVNAAKLKFWRISMCIQWCLDGINDVHMLIEQSPDPIR